MTPPRQVLALALLALAGAAIFAGLIAIGGPGVARLERLDERRLRDIDNLVRWIERYRLTEGELPASLGALESTLPGSVSALDPETGAHYDYERFGPAGFRVCAELSLPDKDTETRPRTRLPGTDRDMVRSTDAAGRRHCLETAGSGG